MTQLEIEQERVALLRLLLAAWFAEWRTGRLAVLNGTPDGERRFIWELAKDTREILRGE